MPHATSCNQPAQPQAIEEAVNKHLPGVWPHALVTCILRIMPRNPSGPAHFNKVSLCVVADIKILSEMPLQVGNTPSLAPQVGKHTKFGTPCYGTPCCGPPGSRRALAFPGPGPGGGPDGIRRDQTDMVNEYIMNI